MRAHFGGFGSSRVFGVLGASALALLVAGCGWFDSTPTRKIESRPGAERNVPAGGIQASGNGHQYDGDIRPVDESRTAPIGSVIPDKGGQKAQLDAAAKDAAERDSAAREAAAKRKAEEAPTPITPASTPPAEAAPVPLAPASTPPAETAPAATAPASAAPAGTAPTDLPGVPLGAPGGSAPLPPPVPGAQTALPSPTPAPAGTPTAK
jgi:hypothetical protein